MNQLVGPTLYLVYFTLRDAAPCWLDISVLARQARDESEPTRFWPPASRMACARDK